MSFLKSFVLFTSIPFFIVLIDNYSFWSNIFSTYPATFQNTLFFISIFLILTLLITLILLIASFSKMTKFFIILILIASSILAYFMDTFGVIIDDHMIQNAFETNTSETMDLLTLKLLGYVVLLGLIPSYVVYKIKFPVFKAKNELLFRLKSIGFSIIAIVFLLILFSKSYASFFREHKPLRFYSNPTYPLYSFGKYVASKLSSNIPFTEIGLDAKKITQDKKPKLVIFVVGEAARADSFSLNGYTKKTNPELENQNIINYSNVSSCGTETAISVPCMFSIFGRHEYQDDKGKATQNVLDILKRANINVLWRDNNSDSKGVALRVAYEDLNNAKNPKLCSNGECFDEILLHDLQQYIDKQTGDTFVVLHQKGSHGPAYYKRYPKEFEKFQPVCRSNQLEQCTQEEIQNSYDNSILYTDYFLTQTIKFLESNQNRFQTALLYSADHGESLGENGIYLHGMPYMLAPTYQTHIGFLQWFGKDFEAKLKDQCLQQNKKTAYSHDNLFHTILGIMQIKTTTYDPKMDMLNQCTKK